jgi:hypothetical protein
VTKSESGEFVAKVAGLKYSTVLVEGDSISLPPDRRGRLTFEQAKNFDIYSFGLLGIWLLFDDATEESVNTSRGYLKNSYSDVLGRLRDKVERHKQVQKWVADSSDLNELQKSQLVRLFDLTLLGGPYKTHCGMEVTLTILDSCVEPEPLPHPESLSHEKPPGGPLATITDATAELNMVLDEASNVRCHIHNRNIVLTH